MNEKRYGEIKTLKNIFPKKAAELVNKGTIGILISECKMSKKTKDILIQGGITVYEGVDKEAIENTLEKLEREKKEEEKE